jgi:excinuclease UvrABC nuclease subunit
MDEFLKTVNWIRAETIRGAALLAPPIGGVYAIGLVSVAYSLPLAIEWVYVGRSANLRRRLSQHDPLFEQHVALRDWMTSGNRIEVWYAVMAMEKAVLLEITLIRELRPKFNRIRYSRNKIAV